MIIGKKRRYIKTLEQKLAASEAERSRVVLENKELRENLVKNEMEIAGLEKEIEESDDLFAEAKQKCSQMQEENGALKRKLDEANKLLSDAADTNAELQQLLPRPSCDGCVNADNYRKCASCARYPKLKDKYEAEAET